MVAIQWDVDEKKVYENGEDRVVLYVKDKVGSGYTVGVPWYGVTKVTESPEGAQITKKYSNNALYANILSDETFKGGISAYTYPDEWAACIGEGDASSSDALAQIVTAQDHREFGLTYRTRIGSDAQGTFGYKIHIIYNGRAGVSSRDFETINDSPDIIEFSWDYETRPVDLGNDLKPTSHLVIDSRRFSESAMKALCDTLWGTDTLEPQLPSPKEVANILSTGVKPTTSPAPASSGGSGAAAPSGSMSAAFTAALGS